jgi:hypothetical protein
MTTERDEQNRAAPDRRAWETPKVILASVTEGTDKIPSSGDFTSDSIAFGTSGGGN